MATEVTLPALGESVTEGTVTRWLKQVGDSVSVDEALLEVSTDKVDTEIPSPVAGTLLEVRASEDETVEVGAVLALIGDQGESTGDGSGAAPAEEDSGADDQADAGAEEQAETGTQEQQPAPAEEPSQPEQPAAREQQAQPEQQEQPSPGGDSSGGGKTTSVTLPALGESVTEGTVTRWLKQVGDEVAVDEALLEVSTDKVDTEIPSPVAGTLLEIRAQEDDTVEVGAVLGVIGASDEASGDSSSGSDDGGQADSAPEPEPEPVPEPAQAETPLEEEQNQRDQAHEQAERADSPAEPAEPAEPAAEEPAAAPAGEAAPSSDGSSDGGSRGGFGGGFGRRVWGVG